MEEIAEVYARALFEVAKEHGVVDQTHDQLGQFAEALNDNRNLAVFFFSPYFSTEEKKDGLKRAVTGAEPVFMNFLEALIERHRMPAIFRIRTRYEELWDAEHKLLPVQVTSAVKLDDDTVSSIGRSDRRADRARGRALQLRRSRHPRRNRAQSGQFHPRRLDQ